MAVSKNLFIDLTTDPLTDWQSHGGGARTTTTLEPDCSFTLNEELSTDQCWLIEAVVSVNAAPLDPDGARLWARFQKHAPATGTVETGSMETYSVQVRLEDDAGTKQLVLYDMAASPSPAAVATITLDRGWDWTDNVPRIRVRLRLDVNEAGDARRLHMEVEPSDDPLFDRSTTSLGVSKDLDEPQSELSTLNGSPVEVGFGNFGTESSQFESVHVSVADKGTALPYWPAPVTPNTDHDTPINAVPGYRIFSPGLGEATIEFDCQDTPTEKYLDGDDLTLSLEVSRGATPAARAYGSVPAGLDSHTFTGLDDEQSVTGKVAVCDVSGRNTERSDTVVVDNSGPLLTITKVSPDYAQVGTRVAVEFTSNEPLDEDTIQVTVGSQNMIRDGLGTAPYRYLYSPMDTDPQGPQTVVVQASDPAGNSGQDTNVGDVNFDFIVPTIDGIGASVDRPFVGNGQTFKLFVNVTDVGSDVDPDAFDITLSGRPLSYVDRSGSTYEFDYAVDAAMDNAGRQSIEVRACDLAGNEAVDTLVDIVTFDFDPPIVAISGSPTDPVGDDRAFSITLTVTDDFSTVDDTSFTVTVGGQTMGEGRFADPAFEFTHTASSTTSLESPQDVVVQVRDEAGNETTQTFPAAVSYDFTPPVVVLEDAPASPVSDGTLVHVTLDISDVYSDIDTGATFGVTLGGRKMNPGGFSHPSYPFSLTVNSAKDTGGAKDVLVTVRDTAGNETTETFPAAVSYDFVGPVVTVDTSPIAPVNHDGVVNIALNVTDEYSQIDIGSTFVVTLGGREMDRDTFTHPRYPFTLKVDDGLDTAGPQDLVVTVRDAAGNETTETFGDLVTFDFVISMALVNDKITLICAKGDDGLFHQQYDPELQITTAPEDDTPYDWELDEIVEWNDITPGLVTVTIDPYTDPVWQALDDTDPRKAAIRLDAIVPVEIDVPDAVWLEEADPTVTSDPWIRFTGTVNGESFSVKVFLRTLTADDFLVFENQNRAGLVHLSQASEAGTPYSWGVESLAGIDAGFTVGCQHDASDAEHLGARIEINHAADIWPAMGASGELLDPDDLGDSTFHLRLSQPGHADSYLHCTLRLRKLIGDRHLVFFGQVYQDDHLDVLWKESGVIAGPGETFSGRVVDTNGVYLAKQPLELNDLLGLAATPTTAPPSGAGDPPWNEDQTFNLRIQAAEVTVVPAAFFVGRGLHFRELSPETLTIADRLTDDYRAQLPGPHTESIAVAGSAETWVFGDLDTFDLDSDLDADRTTLKVVTNVLGITWNAGDLSPRETGDLAVVLLRADSPNTPLSPPVRVSLPVEITRQTGLRVGHGATTATAPDRLPDAYQKLRYKGELEGLVFDLQDGDLLEWTLENKEIDAVVGAANPLELEKPGDQKYETGNPDLQAQHNVLQTRSVPEVAVIPEPLTAQPNPYTLAVSVTHLRPRGGGMFKEIAGGAPRVLKLKIHKTPANLDVAIALDRSGSMDGNRWQSACDGAELFATLMNETGVDSRVGIYWFWEDNGNEDAGILNIGQPGGPDHYTAIGAGLLHCRDELLDRSADTDADRTLRGRVILLVSDGMENRGPKLEPVFFDAPNDHWNLFKAPGEKSPTPHPQGPGIRIHSLAMATGDAWADKLRGVAAATGGLWALDVQHLRPQKADNTAALTQSWFVTSFAGLFGFDEAAIMGSSALEQGQTVKRKVAVSLATDTLVFYQLSSAADVGRWELTVKLPDTDLELTPALAAAHDSITYRQGKMFQMYVVRLGLTIPGHEHRGVGDWTMQLKRKDGASTGHYSLGALSRQDLQCRVDVLTRPKPRPGDEATIQVHLRDRLGNSISEAQVSTKVRTPGPWVGDVMARRVSDDPALVKRLRKSTSKSHQDVTDVTDRVLRNLMDKDELPAGRTYNRRLTEVRPGLYQTRIKMTEAGHYQLDTTVRGEQRFLGSELADLLKPHLRRLRRSLPMDKLTKELMYLRQRYTTRQPFTVAAARQVAVVFEPSAPKSPAKGWFVTNELIRLDVVPTDRRGRLLGPGWADRVTFTGPAGITGLWPSTDNGDGHYWVEIPFKASKPRFDPRTDALAANRLELGHPDGALRPPHDRLVLSGFSAEVLGVRLPLVIQPPNL